MLVPNVSVMRGLNMSFNGLNCRDACEIRSASHAARRRGRLNSREKIQMAAMRHSVHEECLIYADAAQLCAYWACNIVS